MDEKQGPPPSYNQSNYSEPMGGASYPPPGAATYQAPPPGAYQQQAPPPGAYQQQAPPPGAYQQPPPGQANPQKGPPPPGAYPQGGTVMTNQPGPVVYTGQHQTVVVTSAPLTNPPPDYLIFSILVILCCWPIAIAAIIYSCSSRSAANRGDDVTAFAKGQTAKKFCIAAVITGIILITLNIVLRVVAANAA